MSFIEIIGKVALGQAVAEVKEKLKTKKYNDQVDAVFNQTLSAFDRIIFLCQKSDDFGREIFNLAEGKSARIDRLFEAAAAYADNPDIQGVEPYLTPSKIQGELREFSHRLLDGFRQVGSAKLGELPQAFNKFDRDINSYSVVDKTPEEKPQGPPPVYLPRMKNTLLQHHEEWIEKIAATLGQEGRAAVGQETVERAAEGLGAAVSGQGGIGKTAMANEYAHAHVADYPGGVFWLQIDLGLAQALREAAQKLGWDIPDSLDDKQVQEMVLAEIRGRSGLKLLILDNLEDQVVPTEANLPGSHLLVTTRRTDVDLPRVKMDLPLENEALDIFLGYAELDRGGISEAEELAAREICDRVGNLPLALEILGKVARKRGLAQTALRLDDIISEKASVHGKGEVLSIGAALALAEGQYGHPRALEALRFLGYFHAEHIEPGLLGLVMGVDEDEAQRILEALAEFSVIQPRHKTGGYAMHRLVQEVARDPDPNREAGTRVVNVLDAIIRAVMEKGAYRAAYGLITHLLHITDLSQDAIKEEDFPSNFALSRWSEYLRNSGKHQSAEIVSRSCLDRVGRAKGEGHPHYSTNLNNLAAVLHAQGKHDEAEKFYRRALDIDKNSIGIEHPHYAAHLNNLAVVYRAQGKYAKAEELHRRTLSIDEQTIGTENPHYAKHLNNLALVLQDRGQYAEAEKLYRRVLAIDEKTIGTEHPDYAISLANLGLVLREQGNYEEAEQTFRQALEIDVKTIGNEHPEYANRLNNLGQVLRDQKKYNEAEELHRQALIIYARTIGQEHPDYASHLNSLAVVLQEQGKYPEAETLSRDALKIDDRTIGPEHPIYASHLNTLGSILLAQGKYGEVEKLARRVLEIKKGSTGTNHPEYALVLHNLAVVLDAQGKTAEAESFFRHALEISLKTLGPDHPNTMTFQANLDRLLASKK